MIFLFLYAGRICFRYFTLLHLSPEKDGKRRSNSKFPFIYFSMLIMALKSGNKMWKQISQERMPLVPHAVEQGAACLSSSSCTCNTPSVFKNTKSTPITPRTYRRELFPGRRQEKLCSYIHAVTYWAVIATRYE